MCLQWFGLISLRFHGLALSSYLFLVCPKRYYMHPTILHENLPHIMHCSRPTCTIYMHHHTCCLVLLPSQNKTTYNSKIYHRINQLLSSKSIFSILSFPNKLSILEKRYTPAVPQNLSPSPNDYWDVHYTSPQLPKKKRRLLIG